MRGDITSFGCNETTQTAFKYCAPFITYIIKVDGTTIDNDDNLIVYGFIPIMKQPILVKTLRILMILYRNFID